MPNEQTPLYPASIEELVAQGMHLTSEQADLSYGDVGDQRYLLSYPLSHPACVMGQCGCSDDYCSFMMQQDGDREAVVVVPAIATYVCEAGELDAEEIWDEFDRSAVGIMSPSMFKDWGYIRAHVFKVDLTPYYDTQTQAFIELPAWSVYPITQVLAEQIADEIQRNVNDSNLSQYNMHNALDLENDDSYLCDECRDALNMVNTALARAEPHWLPYDQYTFISHNCLIQHHRPGLGLVDKEDGSLSAPNLNLRCTFKDKDLMDFYSDIVSQIHNNWSAAKHLYCPDFEVVRKVGDPWLSDSSPSSPQRPCGYTDDMGRWIKRLTDSARSGGQFQLLPPSLQV